MDGIYIVVFVGSLAVATGVFSYMYYKLMNE